jgi:hypothetical protein
MSHNSKKQSLSKSLYDNVPVYGQDGKLMFYASNRKTSWYLQRNLAVIRSEEPFEIQLTFETNGPGNANDECLLQIRDNICVVCGSEKELTRHHVVPYSFRKFFPSQVKDYDHYDILLLCVECHERYENFANALKDKIAKEHSVPTNGVFDAETANNYRKARAYARTLLNHRNKIPEERAQVLLDKIKSYLNVNNPDLLAISNTIFEFEVKTLGEIVVSKLTDVDTFIQMWRAHFINNMSPKFLPPNWDINRKPKPRMYDTPIERITRLDAECDGYKPGTKVRVVAFPHNNSLLKVLAVEVDGEWVEPSCHQLKYIRKAAFHRLSK